MCKHICPPACPSGHVHTHLHTCTCMHALGKAQHLHVCAWAQALTWAAADRHQQAGTLHLKPTSGEGIKGWGHFQVASSLSARHPFLTWSLSHEWIWDYDINFFASSEINTLISYSLAWLRRRPCDWPPKPSAWGLSPRAQSPYKHAKA